MAPGVSFPKNYGLESIDLQLVKKLINTRSHYSHFKWNVQSEVSSISKPVDSAIQRQTANRRYLEICWETFCKRHSGTKIILCSPLSHSCAESVGYSSRTSDA